MFLDKVHVGYHADNNFDESPHIGTHWSKIYAFEAEREKKRERKRALVLSH